MSSAKLSWREDLIKMLTFYFCVGKIQGALDQMRQGLKTLGVLSYLEGQSDVVRPFFTWSHSTLTAGKFTSANAQHICNISRSLFQKHCYVNSAMAMSDTPTRLLMQRFGSRRWIHTLLSRTSWSRAKVKVNYSKFVCCCQKETGL